MWLYIKLAWRNIFRNTRRTVIAGTAIGLGLACLLFFDSFIIGLEYNMIRSATGSFLGQAQIHGLAVDVQKAGRNPGLQHFQNRLRAHELGQPDDHTEHADIEDDRLADLLHHRLIHGKFLLGRIHFALNFHVTAVGDQQAAGPYDGRELVVGFLGQAHQYIGLDDLGVVDIRVGDDYVRAGSASPRGRAIGLGLDRNQTVIEYGRLGKNDRRSNHPLATRA